MIIYCKFGPNEETCTDLFREILLDDGICCVFNQLHPFFLYKGEWVFFLARNKPIFFLFLLLFNFSYIIAMNLFVIILRLTAVLVFLLIGIWKKATQIIFQKVIIPELLQVHEKSKNYMDYWRLSRVGLKPLIIYIQLYIFIHTICNTSDSL